MIRSEKLTGVVLKRTPIGEADLLVTWFTAELGKIRTVAKSALRTKSRLAYGLSPFSETEVRIAGKLENVSLKLIGAIPKRVILTNPGELEMILSSWVFELILKGSPDHERNQHLYEMLIQSLEVLGDEKFTSEFSDAWRVFFTERIMKSLGWSIQPFLKNGRSGFDQTYATQGGGGHEEHELVEIIDKMSQIDINNFFVFFQKQKVSKSAVKFVQKSVDFYLERTMKSGKVIDAIIE